MTPSTAYFVVWRLGDVGGMERHFCDLAIALHRQGTDVTVFVEQPLSAKNRYARSLHAAGITIVRPSPATRFAMLVQHRWLYRKVTSRRRESPATFALLRALDRQSRRFLPDVVHVHGCMLAQRAVLLWAKARNIPAAYTEHVTIADWDGPHDVNSPEIFQHAGAAIACVSARSRESLSRYIRSPIAIMKHIVPDPMLSSLGPATTAPLRLLAVGRLDACKGHRVLLNAMAILRDAGTSVVLVIAGEGHEREALERLRAELRLEREVTFAGLVDQELMPTLWADADVGILPSLTESFPIVLVENLAAGRPIVASDVGGISEAVTDGVEGFLVPPDDAGALAAAIARFTDHAVLLRTALAARARFEQGTWSSHDAVEQAAQLYDLAAAFRCEETKPFCEEVREERLTPAPPLAIAMCVYRLAAAGDMERRVVRQAVALADMGGDVTVHVDRPVSPRNPRRRELSRAGVRVVAPTLPGWLARQSWAAITGGTGGLPAALERTLKSGKTDAVHIHGWRFGSTWRALDRIVPTLATMNVRVIYEEHAFSNGPVASTSMIVRSSDLLIARSDRASAEIAIVLGQNHPPIVVVEALDVYPWVPVRSNPARELKLFTLVDESVRDRLTELRDVVIVEDIAQSDAVVLTPSLRGYALALGVAMASLKTIILADRDGPGAIRHRVNGLIASNLAEAIEIVREDPLLARQFAVAARRTYNADGYDRPVIAAQLTALYRPSIKASVDARG